MKPVNGLIVRSTPTVNFPVSLPVKLWNPMLEPAEMKELYLDIGGKRTFVVSIHLYILYSLYLMLLAAIECGGGMEYKACGSGMSKQCGEEETTPSFCVEGCYCPSGTSYHDNECIPSTSCPCFYNGNPYLSGSQVKQDCNLW